MVIGGIDEAGYGPVLGPLVVGSSCLRIPSTPNLWDDLQPGGKGLPSVWSLLKPIVSKKRCPKGKRLHVADSKAVYSPSIGLKELERGVLCFLSQVQPIASFDDVVSAADPKAAEWLARHPWYRVHEEECWPLQAGVVGPTVNGLRSALAAANVSIIGLSARVTPEGRYNDLVSQTHNKATALWSLAASLLYDMMERHAHEPGGLVVVCDRQGGREHYVDPLRMMFPDWSLTVVCETGSCAEYELRRDSSRARIIFREKGEDVALPTALASMLCKYLREGLMHRFNRWWSTHVPGVSPTAGYHPDGIRFLGDIAEARRTLSIADADLIRSR